MSDGELVPARAQRIRYHVDQAEAHCRSAVEHAVEAGRLLLEQKAELRHGEWGPWLEAHFPREASTARDYMRLAEHAAQIEGAPSISSALRQIAPPRRLEPEAGEPRREDYQAGDYGDSEHLASAAYLIAVAEGIEARERALAAELAAEAASVMASDPARATGLLRKAELMARIAEAKPWDEGFDELWNEFLDLAPGERWDEQPAP